MSMKGIPDLALLNNSTIEFGNELVPSVGVTIIPGIDSEPILDMLSFTYNVT